MMCVAESVEVMEDVKKVATDVEKVVGSAESLLKERTAKPNQTKPNQTKPNQFLHCKDCTSKWICF